MFQKIFKMLFLSVVVLCCASIIIGCASGGHAPLNTTEQNTDLNERLAAADRNMAKAYEEQWDILAPDQFRKSAERLEKLKKMNAQGSNFEKVILEFRRFDEEYRNAQSLAESRTSRVEGLLAARRKMLDSGMQKNPAYSSRINRLDQKFRSLADDSKINVNEFSELQNEYTRLTGDVTKTQSLTFAKQQIDFAIKNKAKRYAPRALNKAQLDLRSAESVIETNLQDPTSHEAAIKKANFSAMMLAAVVNEQRKVGYNLDEMAALKIVQQSQKMNELNTDLRKKDEELYYSQSEVQDYQKELESTRGEVSQREQELLSADEELAKAAQERRFQAALASAQGKFSQNEADVYRQGDKILIRLKKIEFPSGKTEVPANSQPLLEKVAEVAKELGSQQVIVEGHTDSIGSAEVNKEISQGRADSVKDFLAQEGIEQSILQSEGHGFDKPLTSNKTKVGRAQNRRVDVWIVPEPATTVRE